MWKYTEKAEVDLQSSNTEIDTMIDSCNKTSTPPAKFQRSIWLSFMKHMTLQRFNNY